MRHASTSAEGSRFSADAALLWVEGSRRGGEGEERVGGMEEEEEERGFGCGTGRIRPNRLGSLMEVDLESLLPLTDSDCSVNITRTHSHAQSPGPQSAGGSHTGIILKHTYCMCALKSLYCSWHYTICQDLLKGQFTHITERHIYF